MTDRIAAALVCAQLLFPGWAAPARADSQADPPPSQAPTPCWERRVSIGGQAKGGNAESFHLALGLDLLQRCGRWQGALDVDGNVTAVRTASNRRQTDDFELDLNLQRQLAGARYLPIRLKLEHNQSAGHDLELLAGLGIGARLHQSAAAAWTLEGGVSLSHEDRVAQENIEFPSLFFLSVLDRRLSDTASLTWKSDFELNLEAAADWESDQELLLQTRLAGRVSLLIELEWEFDHRPPSAFRRNDVQSVVSLAIRL